MEPLQLQEEYLEVYGQSSIDPGIIRLLRNILKQAIVDLESAREHRDAVRWFMSDRYYIFSFRWICNILKLDHVKIRKGVTHWGDKKILARSMGLLGYSK